MAESAERQCRRCGGWFTPVERRLNPAEDLLHRSSWESEGFCCLVCWEAYHADLDD
jgi:hypothetical protein